MITSGDKYTHYKRGGTYEIIDVATMQTNSADDGTKVVIYKQLHDAPEYKKGALWVRPIDLFLGDVDVDGEKMKRFKLID